MLSDGRFKVGSCACLENGPRACGIRSKRQFDDCFRTKRFNAIDFGLKCIRNGLMTHNNILSMRAKNSISVRNSVIEHFGDPSILNCY